MKRRPVLISIIVLFVIVTIGGGVYWLHRRNTGWRLLLRAQNQLQAENYTDAIELASRYIEESPQDSRGWEFRGRAYLLSSSYDKAKADFRKAIELQPLNASYHVNLSNCWTYPASDTIALPSITETELREAIWAIKGQPGGSDSQTINANQILDQALETLQPGDEASEKKVEDLARQRLVVRQRRALNWDIVWRGYRRLAAQLAQARRVAEAAGNRQRVLDLDTQIEQTLVLAQEAAQKATDDLWVVVSQDPANAPASEALVRIARQSGQDDLLLRTHELFQKAAAENRSTAAKAEAELAIWFLQTQTRGNEPAQRKQQLRRTIEMLQRRLKTDPKNESVRSDLATLLLSDGRVDEALAEAEKVLASHANDTDALHIKAQVQLDQGQPDKASDTLEPLLGVSGANWQTQHLYAIARNRMGDIDTARVAMQRVIQIYPSHPGANAFLISSYLEEGLVSEGYSQAETFYATSPDNPAALEMLVRAGVTAEKTTDPASAVLTQLARQQELAGQEGPEAIDLGMISAITESLSLLAQRDPALDRSMGLMKSARSGVELAVQAKPQTPEDKLLMARMLQILGRHTQAEAMLKPLLENNPEWAAARFLAAQVYQANRPGLAMENLEQAVKLAPKNQEYRLTLAENLAARGQLDEAMSHVEEVLAVDPKSRRAGTLKARLHISMGDDITSGPVASAISQTPQAGLGLVAALIQKGRHDQAIRLASEEISRDPRSEQAYFWRAQAYAANGQLDNAIEDLKRVIERRPSAMVSYQQVASILARRASPEQIHQTLSSVPGSDPYMVDMVMARLRMRLGQPDAAVNILTKLASRDDTPDWIQGSAAVDAAKATIAAGREEEGIAQLERLSASQEKWMDEYRDDASLALAEWYLRTDQPDKAQPVLMSLKAYGLKDVARRVGLLRGIAPLLMRVGQSEAAFQIAEALKKEFSSEAGALRFQGQLELAGGRLEQAARSYEKSIEMQPAFIDGYLQLSQIYQDMGQPKEALAVLDRLADVGQTGQMQAALAEASFFARRGLSQPAIEAIEKLEGVSSQRSPQVNWILARSHAALGQTDKARALAEAIPPYADQFLPSRLMLVELAGRDGEIKKQISTAQKLLEEPAIENKTPLVLQMMSLLSRDGQYDQCLEVYQSYRKSLRDPAAQMEPVLVNMALQAMLETGQDQEARDLIDQVLQKSPNRFWRMRQVSLLAETEPKRAAEMLPPLDRSVLPEILQAIVVHSKLGQADKLAAWHGRLKAVDGERLSVLASVLAGDLAGEMPEQSDLNGFDGMSSAIRQAVQEYLQFAAKDGSAAESARLLNSLVMGQLGMAPKVRRELLATIEARPESQLAAVLLAGTEADTKIIESVLETLKPADAPVSLLLRANLLYQQRRYEQAAEAFAKAAAGTSETAMLFRQANALEQAGQLEKALPLYLEIYRRDKQPLAANNAAYLVAQLHAKDPQQLDMALSLMGDAIQQNPRSGYLRDTLGYLYMLKGEKEKALTELRLAVTALPESVEVHSHVGEAEKLNGNSDFARWHLSQAVRLAEAKNQDEMTKAEQASHQRARKLLESL
ncbi:MAG: tetratricopeptide repeat protein [Phycisphaerae bacterium]